MCPEDEIRDAVLAIERADSTNDEWAKDAAYVVAANAIRKCGASAAGWITQTRTAIDEFLRRLEMAHDLHAVFTIKDCDAVASLRRCLGYEISSRVEPIKWNGVTFPSAHAVLRDITDRVNRCDTSFAGGASSDLASESFAFLAQYGKRLSDEL